MKRTFVIEIKEDIEDESFTFSLSSPDDSVLIPEDLACMLVEVATTLEEEHRHMCTATRH